MTSIVRTHIIGRMHAYAVTLIQALSPEACNQLPYQCQSLPSSNIVRLVCRVKIDL
jgi:hypothetical protein